MQHDFILLDRSQSMSSGNRISEAVGALNTYVKKLAKEKVDTGVTLCVFDTGGFDILRDRITPATWKNVEVGECPPRGSTPLNDSVSKIVAKANAGGYDKVALVILTDGEENSSVELPGEAGKAAVKSLLDGCRAKNWQVIMLGAQFDNWDQAQSYGNLPGQTVNVAAGNMAQTMTTLGATRTAYAATGKAMNFSDDERAKLASGGNK